MYTLENKIKALAFILIMCGTGLCLWGFTSLEKEYLLVVTEDSQGSSLVITQPGVGGEHYLLQEPGRVESAGLVDEQKVVYQVKKDGKTTTRVFDLPEGNVDKDTPAARLIDYINNKEKRSIEISTNADISGAAIKGPVPTGFRAAAVLPESTYMLGFAGGTLKIFDQDTRALFNTGFEESDCMINLSSGNKKMAIAGKGPSGSLLLFNLLDMQPIYSEKVTGQVTQADWNGAGSALVLVARDDKTTHCYRYAVGSTALKSSILESDKPLRVFYLSP